VWQEDSPKTYYVIAFVDMLLLTASCQL